MIRLDLDAIRARCNAATPGPWRLKGLEIHGDSKPGRCGLLIYDEGGHGKKDAQFIAHARTDIPALLAYIEELVRERDEACWHAEGLRSALTLVEAYRRGAEAMREACAVRAQRHIGFGPLIVEGATTAEAIRAMPIPEEP